jgi:hypothetical protein
VKNELYHSDAYLGETYNDGLYHFKYVSKKRGPDGKWRYYYSKKENNNTTAIYEKVKGNPKSKYGVYVNGNGEGQRTWTVRKSNKMFSSTKKEKNIYDNTGGYTATKNVGKLERNADYTKKQISKIAKQNIKSLKQSINKGQKAIDKLIKKKLTKKK